MTAESRYLSKQRSRARMKGQTASSSMAETLDDLAAAVSNLEGVWPHIGEIWHARQNKIFETGSLGRWAPLKADTIIKKRREGATTEPLIHTGSLLHEVSSTTPRAQGPHFVVFGPQKGAAIDYATHHLRGNGVPQRNPVPRFTPAERKNCIDAIRDFYRPEGGKSQGLVSRRRLGIGV